MVIAHVREHATTHPATKTAKTLCEIPPLRGLAGLVRGDWPIENSRQGNDRAIDNNSGASENFAVVARDEKQRSLAKRCHLVRLILETAPPCVLARVRNAVLFPTRHLVLLALVAER